jgi:3'-phosphoadenosine 5'-phosphosulfate sulfotransferase (PAPS reductase)/FAD synthetase
MDAQFSVFDSIDIQVFDSSTLKYSVDKEYQDLFFEIVGRIKPVLIKNTCRIACSFGKDSNLVLSAALEAHKQALSNKDISSEKPFIVTHIDTGVDDIFVRSQVAYEVRELKNYCEKHGINLVYLTAKPPVRYSWSVMYLSGMKLPSFAKSSADCSVVLKIDPAKKLERELTKQYGDIVTILGVRNDESARRRASIKRHGMDDVNIIEKKVNGQVVRTLAPIVDLTTDDVFAILRRSGTQPIVNTLYPIPTYKAHNKLLIKLYGDAQETCPVASFQPAAEARSGSCGNGSRFGCYTCLKVVKDRSADARERFTQYDRVKHVKLIRDWMAHNADNMSTRTPMGKSLCSVTGAIVVQENTYSAQMLEKLIWWFSQATREDYLFCQRFRELKAQGRLMEDTGYAEIANDASLDDDSRAFFLEHYVNASSEQLIEPLTLEHIMMICAIHARDGIALPPYRALHIWNSVWNGDYIPWPVIEGSPIVDPVPEPRFYLGNFKRTANAKLNFLLADETACSTKVEFTTQDSIRHVIPINLDTDYLLNSRSVEVKHAFTRRKIKKVKAGSGYRFEKGRMSVAFETVSEVSCHVKRAEKAISVGAASTERQLAAQIDVWDSSDVDAGFSMDLDSLDMFILTEYERCLEKHDEFVARRGADCFGGTSPFIEMASYGLFKFTQKSLLAAEKMLARTEQLCFTIDGISLINMTKVQLEAYTVTQDQYRSLKAKALLAIRAERNAHKAMVKEMLALKAISPSKYLDNKLHSLIPVVGNLIKKSIFEKTEIEALVKAKVTRFDGIIIEEYLIALEHTLKSMLNVFCSLEGIIALYDLKKDDVAVRKVAAKYADDLIEFIRNINWKRQEQVDSTWHHLLRFNRVDVSTLDFTNTANRLIASLPAQVNKTKVYQTKKAISIANLPIFRVAS